MEAKELRDWIKRINTQHQGLKQSCSGLAKHFKGFYRKSLLNKAAFVIVEGELPLPSHIPSINQSLISQFSGMDAITYYDTYYIKRGAVNDLSLHFHELVHVIQWRRLGISKFLKRYFDELNTYGYSNAPLERVAHELEDQYRANPSQSFDVKKIVKGRL